MFDAPNFTSSTLRSGVHSLGSRGYSGYSRIETSTGSNSSAEVALGGLGGEGDVIMGVAGLLCVQRPRIGSGGVNKVFTACDRRVSEASIASGCVLRSERSDSSFVTHT